MARPKPLPPPSREEKQKIRLAHNLRKDDPFPRCRGKSAHKVKKLEKAGNFDHSEAGHLCDVCQCHHVAGYGTDHYGRGYCVHHENSIHYKAFAKDYAHKQGVAMQQGFSNVYQYESSSRYLKSIRMAADEAKGRSDLKEELSLLRTVIQEVIGAIDEKMMKTDDLPEKEIKLLDKLTNTVSKLAKTNLEITDTDYVHVDQVKQWAYGLIRVVQDIIPDPKVQQKIIEGFSGVVKPVSGRNV